jgi:hypothetical protein
MTLRTFVFVLEFLPLARPANCRRWLRLRTQPWRHLPGTEQSHRLIHNADTERTRVGSATGERVPLLTQQVSNWVAVEGRKVAVLQKRKTIEVMHRAIARALEVLLNRRDWNQAELARRIAIDAGYTRQVRSVSASSADAVVLCRSVVAVPFHRFGRAPDPADSVEHRHRDAHFHNPFHQVYQGTDPIPKLSPHRFSPSSRHFRFRRSSRLWHLGGQVVSSELHGNFENPSPLISLTGNIRPSPADPRTQSFPPKPAASYRPSALDRSDAS